MGVWFDLCVSGGRRCGEKRWKVGKFTIARGAVDVEANALADAEVIVGKTIVYTGANGEFELTVRKKRGVCGGG